MPDVAVGHQGHLRLMNELDRILDRDDMARRGAVAMIDHGGERGRFAGARGAHHQHHAALGHHDFLERLGQPQLLETRHLVGNGSDDHADIQLLHEHVDPKARDDPGSPSEKLHSSSLANSARWRSLMMACASSRVTSAVNFWVASGCILPWIFMLGGKSFETNRSEPPARVIAVEQLDHVGLGLFFAQRHVPPFTAGFRSANIGRGPAAGPRRS